MDCPQAQPLLNAWLDGELSADDQVALDGHLATCAECRMTADGLRASDRELRRAFAPERDTAARLATRVVERARSHAATSWSFPPWLSLLLATAAGFLVAVLVFRPWEEPLQVIVERPVLVPAPEKTTTTPEKSNGLPGKTPSDVPSAAKPLLNLALATGPVELLPPMNVNWTTCAPDAAVVSGARIRTGPKVRCELTTANGAKLRLNGDTEVSVQSESDLMLTQGQMWTAVTDGGQPIVVRTAEAVVVANSGRFDLATRGGETTLTVIDGSAKVRGIDGERTIAAHRTARVAGGRVVEERPSFDAYVATGWINEILMLKGSEDAELTARLNDILAELGQTKMQYLYEGEVRRLGDHATIPLLKYIESSRSANDQYRRGVAAQIVADVAQPRAVPDLIVLLSDQNPDIRREAARGLQRLTGTDMGRPPSEWTKNWQACEPTFQRWQEWWKRNQEKYPGPPREILPLTPAVPEPKARKA